MNLFKIIKFIFNHPLNKNGRLGSIFRFLKWQINSRLNPYAVVYPFTENSKLLIWKGLAGATGNLYTGLMEFEDMAFLLHFLRENDLFIDIGANIGSYTILASAEVKARTISIEPIPTTYSNFLDNIGINHIHDKVKPLNIGLAKEAGEIAFTKTFDTVNHVATLGEENTIEVNVDTLDNLCIAECPILIKIDVEGFEKEVLLGGVDVLENNTLKAIIIELNGSGKRYGYGDEDIHSNLLGNGFKPYKYNPIIKQLVELPTFGTTGNTIYVRDLEFVAKRISESRTIGIGSNGVKI